MHRGSTPLASTRFQLLEIGVEFFCSFSIYISSNMLDTKLKKEMIANATLILKSVNWTEQEIKKYLIQLEDAEKNFETEKIDQLEPIIRGLIKKLNLELRNMDQFMIHYRKAIDEKKKMLPNSGQKR